MSKRPFRDATAPPSSGGVRGSSESISRVGGAAGLLQERPKTIERKRNYEKGRKIIFTTVLSAIVVFWAFAKQVQSGLQTTPDPKSSPYKQHTRWAKRPREPHHRSYTIRHLASYHVLGP